MSNDYRDRMRREFQMREFDDWLKAKESEAQAASVDVDALLAECRARGEGLVNP